MIIYSAEIPIVLTNGNDGRGNKWFSSSRRRKQIVNLLFARGYARPAPFDSAVDLKITRILGTRQKLWDADSWQRGNLKELIDALVELKWFYDDGPKYIREVRFKQVTLQSRPIESRTIVTVMSIEEAHE
jgi:hypothetical protein